MDEAARQRIKTTPLGVMDILDFSFSYFWCEMMIAGIFCAGIHFPVFLFGALLNFQSKISHIQRGLSMQQLIFAFGTLFIYGGVMFLIAITVFPFVKLWIARVVREKCEAEPVDYVAAAQASLALWPSAVWTLFLQGLIVIGLSFLLIVPGIIWAVYYIFSIYVVAEGSLWGKAALDASKGLVKGRWWETLGTMIVIWLAFLVIEIVVGLIPMVALFACTFFFPKNPLPQALYSTFTELFIPLTIFPVAVWFTNMSYVRNRIAPVTSGAVRPA